MSYLPHHFLPRAALVASLFVFSTVSVAASQQRAPACDRVKSHQVACQHLKIKTDPAQNTPCPKKKVNCVPMHRPRKLICGLAYHPKLIPSYIPSYIKRVDNFHAIEVDGNVMVTVDKATHQQVRIFNNGELGEGRVKAYVRQGILYLKDQSKDRHGHVSHEAVTVKIDTAELDRIVLRDKSSLALNGVHSDSMDLYMDSVGFVRLRGDIHLHHVAQFGKGRIDAQWVDSDHLHLESGGCGQIRLSGRARQVNVQATGHSHVDLSHLRADNAVIRSADTSQVDVLVSDKLAGFATDFSNIYYLKTPQHLTRHTYNSGTVMQYKYWT